MGCAAAAALRSFPSSSSLDTPRTRNHPLSFRQPSSPPQKLLSRSNLIQPAALRVVACMAHTAGDSERSAAEPPPFPPSSPLNPQPPPANHLQPVLSESSTPSRLQGTDLFGESPASPSPKSSATRKGIVGQTFSARRYCHGDRTLFLRTIAQQSVPRTLPVSPAILYPRRA